MSSGVEVITHDTLNRSLLWVPEGHLYHRALNPEDLLRLVMH